MSKVAKKVANCKQCKFWQERVGGDVEGAEVSIGTCKKTGETTSCYCWCAAARKKVTR